MQARYSARPPGPGARTARDADERRAAVELGRAATFVEIASRLGVTEEAVLEARQAVAAHRSSVVGRTGQRGDDAAALGELLGAEDTALARIEDTVMLERLLQQLPQREREILRLRFEEALKQREIGALVGVSQMHVSRLLHQSLERLRAIADTERTGST